MSTARYALRPSALRHPVPIADGFALPWPTVVSGATDGRKTCQINGSALLKPPYGKITNLLLKLTLR